MSPVYPDELDVDAAVADELRARLADDDLVAESVLRHALDALRPGSAVHSARRARRKAPVEQMSLLRLQPPA